MRAARLERMPRQRPQHALLFAARRALTPGADVAGRLEADEARALRRLGPEKDEQVEQQRRHQDRAEPDQHLPQGFAVAHAARVD